MRHYGDYAEFGISAMPLPRTCLSSTRISVSFRCCWATKRSRTPPATAMWRRTCCARSKARWSIWTSAHPSRRRVWHGLPCLGFRYVSTRCGAKPRQTGDSAISGNSACAYASEGCSGCAVMARTRLGSGIARDLKSWRSGCETSFIRKKICVGV